MTVAAIAILIMTIVVGVNSISLKQKEKKYAAREQELQELIKIEEQHKNQKICRRGGKG